MSQLYRVPAGAGIAIPIEDGIRLVLKPGAGGTMEYSEVNGSDADAHNGAPTSVAVKTVVDPEWPVYYVTAVTQPGYVSVV